MTGIEHIASQADTQRRASDRRLQSVVGYRQLTFGRADQFRNSTIACIGGFHRLRGIGCLGWRRRICSKGGTGYPDDQESRDQHTPEARHDETSKLEDLTILQHGGETSRLKFGRNAATGKTMLSPVGLPPQAPVPPDNDLVPALDRAIVLPTAGAGAGTWQAGSLLSASVRYQNDEMMLKVGDRFFSTRPIPGVAEGSQLSLQVARDPSGSMMLVPMLPLAGRSASRIGGAPPVVRGMTVALAGSGQIAPTPESTAPIEIRVPSTQRNQAVQTLAARLETPHSLLGWINRPVAASTGMTTAAGAMGTEGSTAPSGVSGWLQAVTASFVQSGLFYEARLKERRPIPVNDVKRQLLDLVYRQPQSAATQEAWAALDELVGFQSAATVAHQAGGCCYSFALPAPDGLGAWWVVFQQDPRRVRDEGAASRDPEGGKEPPWRIRLTGISLPDGNLDIRLEQVGETGVAVTLLTAKADRASYWESARDELSKRFEESGLELARWSVIDPRAEKAPPIAIPGQLRAVRA